MQSALTRLEQKWPLNLVHAKYHCFPTFLAAVQVSKPANCTEYPALDIIRVQLKALESMLSL